MAPISRTQEQDPKKVDQFVKMALDLTHDDEMKIADTRGGWDDSPTIRTNVVQGKGGPISTDFRPRSLTNAAAWMKANTLDPNRDRKSVV